MTNGLLINGEIFVHFLIYCAVLGSPSSFITLQLRHSEFLIYEENFIFFFISAVCQSYNISISHTYICARSTHIYTMFVYWLRALLPPPPPDHYRLYCVSRGAYALSRKLKSRYGARNRFQEPSLELRSQAT
jgi:hypothetical protein